MEKKSDNYSTPNGESSGDKLHDTWFLQFTIYTGLLPLIFGGAHITWLSSTYPSLITNNSFINPLTEPADLTDISLIGGLPIFAGLLGPLLLIKLSDKIGRKLFLQASSLGLFGCTVALAFANHAVQILAFRCILFIFLNAYGTIIQVYIGEICEETNRSKYLCIMGVCLPLGFIYGYYFGPVCTYRIFTIILCLPLLPFFGGFCFAPETPVYLLARGKVESCFEALKKLRGNKNAKQLQLELDRMRQVLVGTNASSTDKTLLHLILFRRKEIRVAALITMGLGMAQHTCGMSVTMTYLGPLLNEAKINLTENTMTVTVAVIQTLGALSTSFFIAKIGRKVLLITSSIGCGIALLVWGYFYNLKIVNKELALSFTWLPLLAIVAYNVMFSVGLSAVPVALISEIFTSDFVSAGVCLYICTQGVSASAMVATYPLLASSLGVHNCLWIYAGCSLATGLAIYALLPETKGKSLPEVQEMLRKF